MAIVHRINKLGLTADGPSPLLSLEHICRYAQLLVRPKHAVATLFVQQSSSDHIQDVLPGWPEHEMLKIRL